MSIALPSITEIIAIAKEAGSYLAEEQEHERVIKASPSLTAKRPLPLLQDIESNKIICKGLANLGIPVFSEENPDEINKAAKSNSVYALVDPLDGSKRYQLTLQGYAVFIAIMVNNTPVKGVAVYPSYRYTDNISETFYTGDDGKAYREENIKGEIITTEISSIGLVKKQGSHTPSLPDDFWALVGKRALKDDLRSLTIPKGLEDPTIDVNRGAFKNLLLASGKINFVTNTSGPKEWDTAALHAILMASGAQLVDKSGKPLTYGKDDPTQPESYAANIEILNFLGITRGMSPPSSAKTLG